MPLIDHFSLLAPFYETAIRLGNVQAFMQRAALPVNGWMLDAGGGTGRVSYALRHQAKYIVVADESWGMLKQASAKNGLLSVRGVTETLPFAAERFDRIIMVDALHHVADHQQSLGELWRVLKPGGRIVIEEPDVRTLIVKLVAIGEKLALMRSHFLAPPRIAAMFPNQNARKHIEVEGYNAWVMIEKTA